MTPLAQWVRDLDAHPGAAARLDIIDHRDYSAVRAQALPILRAKRYAVSDWLIELGVDQLRLHYAAVVLGADRPALGKFAGLFRCLDMLQDTRDFSEFCVKVFGCGFLHFVREQDDPEAALSRTKAEYERLFTGLPVGLLPEQPYSGVQASWSTTLPALMRLPFPEAVSPPSYA